MDNIISSLKSLAVSIESVKLDPKNARKHPERNIETIKKSLAAYGQRKPIVVNKETGFIEAGNGLWQAAKDLGWDKIAVAYVKDDKEVATAYGLMDNQSSDLSSFDLPSLKDLIESLDDGSVDMDLTGFSSEEIEDLMTKFPELTKLKDVGHNPPALVWALIAIPAVKFSQIAQQIDALSKIDGIIIKMTVSDDKDG